MQRRTFLFTSGAALSGLRAAGANDRINVAVIGVRGRGQGHVAEYAKRPDAAVAAVCDIDTANNERAVQLALKLQAGKPKEYRDIRQVLDDKNIDAVSIATCNHWHALAAIWACQAGKDVYVEKPASHNIWEGRQMVEAARKYGRIVQVGHQSRSTEHKKRAIELLRQGVIGKLYMAKGLCFKRRPSIGKHADGPVPPGVDYNAWLGPAPARPFNPNRFHYNWHWFWDYGNGDIGNQGVHEMDIARWGLGKNALPRAVSSSGGRFAYDDDQETPNTQLATFEYDDCHLVFEVRGLLTGIEAGIGPEPGSLNSIGNIFFGSDGYMTVDMAGFKVYLGEKREPGPAMKHAEPRQWDTSPHIENFLKAVRSRKHTDLTCDVAEGRLSAALCHLANVSYRVGRKLDFDPARETFGNDKEANRLLTREYRVPFVVPERV